MAPPNKDELPKPHELPPQLRQIYDAPDMTMTFELTRERAVWVGPRQQQFLAHGDGTLLCLPCASRTSQSPEVRSLQNPEFGP